MYNYYIDQKLKYEENKKLLDKEISNNSEIKHKIKTRSLSSKYNKRIVKFILGLVKDPIIINDYVHPIENTRNQYNNQNFNFSFKHYIPDKERIVYIIHIIIT
jgi:hypothetical protein